MAPRWLWFSTILSAIIAVLVAVKWKQSDLKAERLLKWSETANKVQDIFDIRYHLGGYGPYVTKSHNLTQAFDTAVPKTCRVEQVHMLARHAERYPTNTAGMLMLELCDRIGRLDVPLNASLAFANNWTFFSDNPARDFEQLTSTGSYAGTLTSFRMGTQLRTAYKQLVQNALDDEKPLRIWASDSQRVIDTAKYFSYGLAGLDQARSFALEIIPETEDRGANTLTPGDTCLKYAHDADEYGWNYGSRLLDEFLPTYLNKTHERLLVENPALPLSVQELYVMQEICGFELQAAGASQWCDVFTEPEWTAFEYARDLLHYYRSGPGNPYASAMGWLWLNATANLLGEGAAAGNLFFSFVHDGDIIPMLAALELFPQEKPLPTTHIDHGRSWRVSDTVPMGARIIFELLSCDHQDCWDNGPLYPNHVYCTPIKTERHVRIIVNERSIPLPGCDAGPGWSCPLSQFLAKVKKQGAETGEYATVCGLSDTAPKAITFLRQ